MNEKDRDDTQKQNILGMRLLIVDDNEISVMVLNEMLKTYNCIIDIAMSGKEAINYANKTKYNMIFMDYMMPEMNGLETTSYIRKSGKNDITPVIIMSGSVDESDIKKYKANGIDDCLAKPTDARELKRLLYKWIPGLEALTSDDKSINIPGIDATMGLDNFGDNIFYYFEILRMFCKNSAEKAKEIKLFLEKRNYSGYTIEVHGLKGEAAIIGATELALLAKELEVAGKAVQGIIKTDTPIEKNLEFIEFETPNLIELYMGIVEDIKNVVGSDEDQDEAPEKQPNKAADGVTGEKIEKAKRYISHAIESIGNGDADLAVQWLNEVLENIL